MRCPIPTRRTRARTSSARLSREDFGAAAAQVAQNGAIKL